MVDGCPALEEEGEAPSAAVACDGDGVACDLRHRALLEELEPAPSGFAAAVAGDIEALDIEEAKREIMARVIEEEEGVVCGAGEVCEREATDVALAALYAECRRYEAIERERVGSILRGLRAQGTALREMMDQHRQAVRGCAGLLKPSVAGAQQLALSVAKGSRAIVHRAIRHMAVCTTVGAKARASVVDAACSVTLRFGADVELQQTAVGLVAWFAAQETGDSTSLHLSRSNFREGNIHALGSPREMIARPKMSEIEWKTTEIRGF